MSNPIVFIHYGECDYLKYSLIQAKMTNPKSEIYLMGDEGNRHHDSSNAQFVPLDEYTRDLDFAQYYRHISPNPVEYELFCIERLFLLKNFMIRNQFRKCCYLDSDMFLFMNDQDRDSLDSDIIFNYYRFRSIEALVHFCTFVMEHYMNDELFQRLIEFQKTLDYYEGISDMVLLEYFRCLYPDEAGLLSEDARSWFICNNINIPEGLEALDGKKKIYLINGGLYGKYEAKNRGVPLGLLHFQGTAKTFMESIFLYNYLDQSSDIFYFDYESQLWRLI